MTILKTALEAIEILSTGNTSEQAQAQAADARIKLMNAMAQVDFIAVPRDGNEPLMGLSLSEQEDEQTVEPVAYLIDWPDDKELGHYFSKTATEGGRSTPLYLHPPQQARENLATEQISKAFDAAVEVVGEHRVAKALAGTSGERAELIAKLKGHNEWVDTLTRGKFLMLKAADMLEADAQQAMQDKQDWSRFHHLMKKHGLHPGRTDDDLLEILDEKLSEQAQQAKQVPLSSGAMAGPPEQIVRFMGKAYKVVPDAQDVFSPCTNCAFNHDENHGHALEDWDAEGDVAPTNDCIRGHHYYVEVTS